MKPPVMNSVIYLSFNFDLLHTMKSISICSIFICLLLSRAAFGQEPGKAPTLPAPAPTLQPPPAQIAPKMPQQQPNIVPQTPSIMPQMAIAQRAALGGNYADTLIGGWKIKINSKLTSDHHLMTTKALGTLTTELAAIEKKLPAESLPYLKEMNIWLEFSTPNNIPVQYHRSAQALAQNGYDIHKESSLEVVAIDYQNLEHESLPLLGPIAGAYHDRVLGANNRQIASGFEHAKESKIYGDSTAKDSFAMKGEFQYFVALSSAYFGEIEMPPFNRSKLKSMDPDGYKLVEKMWGPK